MTPLALSLFAAVADEIRDIRALMEDLAEVLVSDQRFLLANIEQLQKFDLAIQRADESADLLERLAKGAESHAAIDSVRLTIVQDKLRAALVYG
jgi:hypothetical protein